MKRCMFALCCSLFISHAQAWNGAGHRLAALIAWQQLSKSSQVSMHSALQAHPDYPHWLERSRTDEPAAIFAEASTWADNIRNDPRYYDEQRESPSTPIAGLPDHAKHKRWHYVDSDKNGQTVEGELDQQIERLSKILRSTQQNEEITWALPWLLHLVADMHQPLHTGHAEDEGGNRQEIENPFRRQPFQNLHSYWDELPGPASLRGKRLEKRAKELVDRYKPRRQGNASLWRKESQALLGQAYPSAQGSLLPLVTPEFDQAARATADQRITIAGYRLGRLLEEIFQQRVSRETKSPTAATHQNNRQP